MESLTEFSPKHLVVKRNLFCVYCGTSLHPFRGGEKEHVIGRRFVPKGTLSGQWNLVVRSCPDCNNRKADLEDDLSAITMQPDSLGQFAVDDDRLRTEAARKGQTQNRRTRRRVSEPNSPLSIESNFGPLQCTISFTSPAQPDTNRVFELARFQLVGFFYLLTYDEAGQRGLYWAGDYAPVVMVRHMDWGNPRLRWLEKMSERWEHCLYAETASGFYKIWIRRGPGEPIIWSWAMEWNKTFRLAGFFGNTERLQEILLNLPPLDFIPLPNSQGRDLRIRKEIALSDQDDTLFVRPPRRAG